MTEKCPDCGVEPYDSLSSDHVGEKEHLCSATKGMIYGTPSTKSVPEPKKKKPTISEM